MIALRIQTGSKPNNCPFHTVLQYIKVWLQRHLGVIGCKIPDGERDKMRGLNYRERHVNGEVKNKCSSLTTESDSVKLMWLTSIPQNINPHNSGRIFLENTLGIIHVGFDLYMSDKLWFTIHQCEDRLAPWTSSQPASEVLLSFIHEKNPRRQTKQIHLLNSAFNHTWCSTYIHTSRQNKRKENIKLLV